MTVTVPESVSTDGNITTWWVTTIADPTAPKVATEIDAASSLMIQCFLKEYVGISTTVEEVEDWRACMRDVLATPGTSKTTIDPLVITIDPQNPAGANNKAYAALTPGTDGHIVVRYGVPTATAAAASQIVDVFPVTVASRDKQKVERNSQLKAEVKVMLRGQPQYDKALAA